MNDRDDGLIGFEQELHRALRRVEAPAAMSQSLMAALAAEDKRTQAPGRGVLLRFRQRSAWIGSVAASLLLASLLLGGLGHRRTEERLRAERDFAKSLEITDRAFDQTRRELQRAGISLDD